MNRRDVIRAGIASPLMGIVSSTASAAAVTPALLTGYSEWLFYERQLLSIEMYPGISDASALVPIGGVGTGWHFRSVFPQRWNDLPQPSTRAAMIMAAAGVIAAPNDFRGTPR